MKKVILAFGTRPEAIKMCPLVNELKSRKNIEIVVCITGQHKQMLDQVLEIFQVEPQYNLSIMKEGQTLSDITVNILQGMGDILEKEKPELVLVHGDTTTAFAVSLACFYKRIPIGHVEAGLRTYDMSAPYPEEFNRQAIDLIAEYYFAPTEASKSNLMQEGKAEKHIYVTGNTAIDALHTTVRKDFRHPLLDWARDSRLILLTAHRRENLGSPLRHIFRAVKRISEEFKDLKIVYPIHLNPVVRKTASEIFQDMERIMLVEPLDALDFHNLMAKAYLVLTDSGGIQEEAPSLGKPVLVLRDTTERPEGVEAGTLKLIGTEEEKVYYEIKNLLIDQEAYNRMSIASNPYGDGHAAGRIADIIENA